MKMPEMPHAKDAKGAKSSEINPLRVLCDLCVRLFQQAAKAWDRFFPPLLCSCCPAENVGYREGDVRMSHFTLMSCRVAKGFPASVRRSKRDANPGPNFVAMTDASASICVLGAPSS